MDSSESRVSKKTKRQRTNGSKTTHDQHARSQNTSPFVRQRTSFYVPLSPIGSAQPLESLCAEHLSPLLLTYFHPFRAVVLSYSNVTLSSTPTPSSDEASFAKSHAEYATPYTWITATFTLFRPSRGTSIPGHVNVSSSNHLGLICYNLFNANIERKNMPVDWKWKASAGSESTGAHKKTSTQDDDEGLGEWVDAEGYPVATDEPLSFTVADFEAVGTGLAQRGHAGLLDIEGSLKDSDEIEGQTRSNGAAKHSQRKNKAAVERN